jgi:hypothetical protein
MIFEEGVTCQRGTFFFIIFAQFYRVAILYITLIFNVISFCYMRFFKIMEILLLENQCVVQNCDAIKV